LTGRPASDCGLHSHSWTYKLLQGNSEAEVVMDLSFADLQDVKKDPNLVECPLFPKLRSAPTLLNCDRMTRRQQWGFE